MCGIVGYVGTGQAAPILLDGLARLEYRGYDSAGIAVLERAGAIDVTRTTDGLKKLQERVLAPDSRAREAHAGIAHTRWATHGRASAENAHPHCSNDGKVAIVHNGIFENHREILADLAKHGLAPHSETDTECFPMLVSHLMSQGMAFEEAFSAAVAQVRGLFAVVCIHADHPDKLLVARSGPPLVLGIAPHGTFVASDVTPLVQYTRDVIFLENGDVAELTREGVRMLSGMDRSVQRADWDADAAELGAHAHFMHKEIFEQPNAVARTLEAHVVGDRANLELPFGENFARRLSRIEILACGTSWHAGLVGKFLIEELAGVPVEVDYASEYRYRSPIQSAGTLAIAITQSGETADTVAAITEAAKRGARTLAVCNVVGSQAARLAEGTLFTHAGPEIGVASTKAFTTQLVLLALFAVQLGRMRGRLDAPGESELVKALWALPDKLSETCALERRIAAIAEEWHRASNALYLGRGLLYPVALEGALKLKEISYVHAEGQPAGEMKHGPIALIDATLPVVALVANDENRERMVSNLHEAAARDGKIIAFVPEGEHGLDPIAHSVVSLPVTHPRLAPILFAVPLQLLAYHIAVLRGCNVDRPRNLAKSVTVE